jgi:beta-mannosidase
MRKQLKLTHNWFVRQVEPETADIGELSRGMLNPDGSWMQAEMPAQVHDILITRRLLPDPRLSKNAEACTWVGDFDWVYACSFTSPDGTGPVFLRLDGLDTIATVYLNEVCVGRFNNMNRRYAVEVRTHLRSTGEPNVLLILFSSPIRTMKELQAQSGAVEGFPPHMYIRKSMSDFSSYLGARPYFPKVGIFADVSLDIPDRIWIDDVWVRPRIDVDLKNAEVNIQMTVRGEVGVISWSLIDPEEKPVAEGVLEPGIGDFQVNIPQPRLWWPRTHGGSPLYTLRVAVSLAGVLQDERVQKFGIRSVLLLLRDKVSGENRFLFEVNGKRIFLKGACLVPFEGMTHCWPVGRVQKLLDLAEQAHMNILRVWADGELPADEFYDECDRRGILVWQDFMFGYGMHPIWVPEYEEIYRLEAEETIRRLRNHTSIFLWCGGNENLMGWNFAYREEARLGRELFDAIAPQAVKQFDPDRPYHPSSPSLGPSANWPLEGDTHDYTFVMWSPQTSVPLFVSEIGRTSAPSISSMRRFLSDEEIWPDGFDPSIRKPGQPGWPPMWEYRNAAITWDEVSGTDSFCDPASPEDLIRNLGIAHGEYLQHRIERFRRGTPDGAPAGDRRCGGVMIWRLNDAWPILYFAVVDYYLEPKIAFYYLRRAYAPVLVCFEHTQDDLYVWVVNDSPDPVSGRLVLKHKRFDGTQRGEISAEVTVPPGKALRCLDAASLGFINLRGEFLQARLNDCESTLLFKGERYLHLPQAKLSAALQDQTLNLTSDVFSRQVALTIPGISGAIFEDNYFDLAPGQTRQIQIMNSAGGRRVQISALNADEISLNIPLGYKRKKQ